MADPGTISLILYYLSRTISSLPKTKQVITSLFSGNSEEKPRNSSVSENFRKAEHDYYKKKLELDTQLLVHEKKKQSIDQNNQRECLELQQIGLELKAEISAKRFELLREFQRDNVELKWTEIKLDWDSKNNWFSKINRIESEQILNKYADCLLILTSPPKIAKDANLHLFRDLDFELQMRNLEDFVEKNYPCRKASHPVKHFSNYFKEPIGKMEVEQLHHIFSRISTYVIYPDITEKDVTFRVAYWSINGELEFFPDSFKWNWKETQNELLAKGQNEERSISTIRDMFVSFHKILTAFWIDYYYLSIDPFYNPRFSSLESESELQFLLLHGQIGEAFKELQNQQYNQYLNNLHVSEDNMNSNNENQQATEILKSLQRLFSDRPEVLRLLDPSNLDPDRIAGEVILDNYRNQEGFASTVNLYVTGRTGAGKTSLGNTIFDSKQKAMKSTGYMNCTDDVGCFQSANNLQYFDLPGVASNQDFENINRAALGIDQIFSKRRANAIIKQFILSDYTDYQSTNKAKQETIFVEKWQSTENQLIKGPDVILYVIAPHAGFVNDDEDYLFDLLSTQKNKRSSSNVIIALNLHLNNNGSPKYTKENIEDVHKLITNIYNEVYSDNLTKPVIIEINSLTGTGSDKIAEEICKLLPTDKLGKMEEILGDKLKEKARQVRSKKFREALIYIASRLATFKVDQSFDNSSDIVLGSYAAVYSYSSKVFKKEVPSGENAYGVVSNFADQTKESRTENITIKEPIIESIERFTTISEPVYKDVEETSQFTMDNEEIVVTKRDGFFGLDQKLRGSRVDKVKQPKVVEIKTTRNQQTGTKTTRVSDGYETAITGYNDKIVGLKHLKGGYDIIKGILSIGLGIESLPNENIGNFNRIYEAGEKEISIKVGNLKSKIEQVINNSDSKKAENEIIQILKKALL